MSLTVTITGKVTLVGEHVKVSEKFEKKEIRVKVEEGNFSETYSIEASNQNIDKLDSVSVGDTVEVKANLKGREWNDKCFTSLQLWNVNVTSKANDDPPF